MHDIIRSPETQVRMSSLELVEFINANRKDGAAILAHSDLLKKAPIVLDGGEGKFSSTYLSAQNKQLPCYLFPKREACLMAMSYSYDLQAKVYDRMTELEQERATQISEHDEDLHRAGMPRLPASYAEALRALAGEVEAREALALENTKLAEKVEVNQRKADHFDITANSEGLFSINTASKNMGFKRMGHLKLIEFMAAQGILMRGGYKKRSWIPKQIHIQEGRFEVKQKTFFLPDGEVAASFTTQFTQKGLAYMVRLLLETGHERNVQPRELAKAA